MDIVFDILLILHLVALGVGVLMVAVRYGGVEAFNSWFWVKMALVVLIVIAMVISAVAPKGSVNPTVLGWVTRLSLLGIVIAAVLAFK